MVPTPKLTGVINTGPMISVLQCGRVDVLQALFDRLYVTTATVPEFAKHGVSVEFNALVDGALVRVRRHL